MKAHVTLISQVTMLKLFKEGVPPEGVVAL
jgi:hypothetical protein